MPYLKSQAVRVNHPGPVLGLFFHLKVYVSASGEFYAPVPETVPGLEGLTLPITLDGATVTLDRGKLKIFAQTYDALIAGFTRFAKQQTRPEVTEHHVIRFNIESHVAFAVDGNGQVFPNPGFEGAEWPSDPKKYGNHHAAALCPGGYSLLIGAEALTKTTYKRGGREHSTYKPYYGEGGHNSGRTTPAELLNSWCSFELEPDAREIPYSDEAALFFYELMLGLANLSKLIQESTFNHGDLIRLIESNTKLLK